MTKYKIPRPAVFKDFGILRTISGTYVCPGWIPVDEGTTRKDIEFSDDITIEPGIVSVETSKTSQKDLEFKVPSSNGKSEYLVTFKRGQWNCNCPASSFRRGHCKHIKALETKIEVNI
jgi:hypothetical protein